MVRDVRSTGSNKEWGIFCYFIDRNVRRMVGIHILKSTVGRPFYLTRTFSILGHAVAKLIEALRYKPDGRWFDSRWCHWNFSLTLSFRPHYGPGVDSVSNRHEHQEYFLGGKVGRCVGLTNLTPSCADCFEICEPQPPGTLRACPGL